MKKKRSIIFCLIVVMTLSACSSKKKSSGAETYIYYTNKAEDMLETKEYDIKATETEQMIEELLGKLKDPGKRYQSVFPDEIEVTKYELKSNQLRVYFNNAYLQMKKSKEVLLRAAVVQTMVQIPEVEFVSFYIGEDPLMDNSGNVVGLMNANDFVQGTEISVKSYQTADLILYFSNSDGTKLVREERNGVRYSSNVSIEKLVIEQLLKGANSRGASATIPKTSMLLGVSVKNGICYVNFDAGFLIESYNRKPEVTIYSIVNSLLANTNATEVQILINGASDNVYMNVVDLSRPLQMNTALIEE